MLLEYSKVYKLKHENCVKTPFLSCIFNYEVLDRREKEQRIQTAVSISHAESAFVSFSDQFDLRNFLKYMDYMCITRKLNIFVI